MTSTPIFGEGETTFFAQSLALRGMTSTAQVLRMQTGSGAASDFVATPATAAGIPARAQPSLGIRSGREMPIKDRDQYQSWWEVWLAAGTDVHVEDRINVNGIIFRVLHVTTGETYEVVRRCMAVKVE